MIEEVINQCGGSYEEAQKKLSANYDPTAYAAGNYNIYFFVNLLWP